MKAGAKRKHIDWALSDDEVMRLMKQNCYYCGTIPTPSKNKRYLAGSLNGDFPSNGLDRVDSQRGYTSDNVVPCCSSCNFMKRAMTISKFKQKVSKIYRYPRKEEVKGEVIELDKLASEEKHALKLTLQNTKKNARIRELYWAISDEFALDLMCQPCFYCGSLPEIHNNYRITNSIKCSFRYNGIDRVDNSKGYILDNVVPCCSDCNYMKRAMSISEFKDRIAKIYKYWIENGDS